MKKSCFPVNRFTHFLMYYKGILFFILIFFIFLSIGITVRSENNITPSPTPIIFNGDVNNDNHVDFSDIELIVSRWHLNDSSLLDQYRDAYINSFDFSVTAEKIKK